MKTSITLVWVLCCMAVSAQNENIKELWNLYNAKNFQQVITAVEPLLEKAPQNVDLNLLLGRSYADMGQYKKAVPYLKSAAEYDSANSWRKAWALSYLGSSQFLLDDYQNAGEAVKACIALNATKNATKSAYGIALLCGYHDFYKSWKVMETEHFRFHFQDMNDDEMESFSQRREGAFEDINQFFASDMPKKIDFFVWNSREDARQLLRTNLGFARPSHSIVHAHYRQTLGHEMTHVISNYSCKMQQKTGLINEGTAVCFDLSKRNKEQMVKDWVNANNRKVDVQAIWNDFSSYPNELTYPMSGLFVQALIDTFGKEKFKAFFGKQSYAHAKAVFGEDLDKLILDFEKRMNS